MDLCKICNKPLIMVIDPEENDELGLASRSEAVQTTGTVTVPDDVGLNCGCHFHLYCSPTFLDSEFAGSHKNIFG